MIKKLSFSSGISKIPESQWQRVINDETFFEAEFEIVNSICHWIHWHAGERIPWQFQIQLKHYPILNDRLVFLPNYFNIPYAVESSNSQPNPPKKMQYLCGKDIENLKDSAQLWTWYIKPILWSILYGAGISWDNGNELAQNSNMPVDQGCSNCPRRFS